MDEVRHQAFKAGGRATDCLDIALLRAGYEQRDEYGEELWVLVDRAFYEVAGDFPRIESGDLRPGVEMVTYSIRVSDCQKYAIDVDATMSEVLEMSDLQAALDELREDVMLEAEAGGVFQQEAFFTLFAEVASENGDTIDLEHAHCHRDGGPKPYRVDGHAFDHDRGTLHLAVCDYREAPEVETLNAAQLDANLKRVTNFVENSFRPEFINALEDSSAAFEAAYPIYSNRIVIKRVRVILFTNARLAARRPPELADEVAGLPVVYSVLDLSRYADIQNSRAGPESIEVDIEGNCRGRRFPA